MKTKYLALLFLMSFLQYSNSQNSVDIIERWDLTDKMIWNHTIDKDAAIDSIELYVPLAVQYCKTLDISFTKRSDWVFPMTGYTAISYRNNGKDYKDEKFEYFQGGDSKGHPAHDIFILDADSNVIEDATGKKIEAVAIVSGVIINIKNTWVPGDLGRGGNFVKLFDPVSKAIFYYSHLDSVLVQVGQIVRAGETVGIVGRTGRKAVHGRTHLHIAYYKIEDGEPIAQDIIKDIYKAEKKVKSK
ncbi:MAG: M23 family metallopeptidase [Ignavibacteriae bacterium]|nr:MAG: M23 family metallopeptidase [Ignavibacteriota bacterium]